MTFVKVNQKHICVYLVVSSWWLYMWLILYTGNMFKNIWVLFLGRRAYEGISYINSTHLQLGESQQIWWRKKVCQPVPRHLCLGDHPLFCAWDEHLTVSICKSQNQQIILQYNLFLNLTTELSHFIAVRKNKGIFSNFQGSSRGQT